MDATLGFILIFVLAVFLVALGIGLSRRRAAQGPDRDPRGDPAIGCQAHRRHQGPRGAPGRGDRSRRGHGGGGAGTQGQGRTQ